MFGLDFSLQNGFEPNQVAFHNVVQWIKIRTENICTELYILQVWGFVFFVPCFYFWVFPVFPVLCFGLPGDCCDGWPINHSTHLWLLLYMLMLFCSYIVQLQPNSFVFWEFFECQTYVFSLLAEALPLWSIQSCWFNELQPPGATTASVTAQSLFSERTSLSFCTALDRSVLYFFPLNR